MKYKEIIVLLLISLLFTGCSQDHQQKVESLINQGEYEVARKLLSDIAEDGDKSDLNTLLLAKSYRKEYFTTYYRKNYQSPLECNWEYFPVGEFNEFAKCQKLLEKIAIDDQNQKAVAEEYYFYYIYSYYRWKYQGDVGAITDLENLGRKLKEIGHSLDLSVALWSDYANSDFNLQKSWDKMMSTINNSLDSRYAALLELNDLLESTKDNLDLPTNIEVVRDIRHFQNSYPQLAVYADSIFIYKNICEGTADIDEKDNGAVIEYLQELLDMNISTNINHYLLQKIGIYKSRMGEIEESLKILTDLAGNIRLRYEREKVLRTAADIAINNDKDTQAITLIRQLANPKKEEMFSLWKLFIGADNEVEADRLWEELKPRLSKTEVKKAERIKYRFNLGKLQISELNMVKAKNSVTVEGIISNSTQKNYQGIIIEITLTAARGSWKKSSEITISEMYENTEEKFNAFIDYNKNDIDLQVSARVKSYRRLL